MRCLMRASLPVAVALWGISLILAFVSLLG